MTGVCQKLTNQDLPVVKDTRANATCGILIADVDLNCSVMESNVNWGWAGRVVMKAGGTSCCLLPLLNASGGCQLAADTAGLWRATSSHLPACPPTTQYHLAQCILSFHFL